MFTHYSPPPMPPEEKQLTMNIQELQALGINRAAFILQEGTPVCRDLLRENPNFTFAIPNMPEGVEGCVHQSGEGVTAYYDLSEGYAERVCILAGVIWPDSYGPTPLPHNPPIRDDFYNQLETEIIEGGERFIVGPQTLVFDLVQREDNGWDIIIPAGGVITRVDFNAFNYLLLQIDTFNPTEFAQHQEFVRQVIEGNYRFKEGDLVPPEYIGKTANEMNRDYTWVYALGAATIVGAILFIMINRIRQGSKEKEE